MHPTAATATNPAGAHWVSWLILTTLAAGAVAIYAGVCWHWPFTGCKRCAGTGRRASPSGKNWRRCRPCKGSGTRIRRGRWVLDKLRNAKEEA